MKYFFIAVVLCVAVNAQSQGDVKVPLWASNYLEGKSIPIDTIYYYGVGSSTTSFEDADKSAFADFATQISTQVSKTIKTVIEEKSGNLTEQTNVTSQQVTDVLLKGMKITERYTDNSTPQFLSLIKVMKEDYYNIVRNETRLQLENELASSKLNTVRHEIDAEKKREADYTVAKEQADLLSKEKQETEALKNEIEVKRIESDRIATKETADRELAIAKQKLEVENLKKELEMKRIESIKIELMKVQFKDFFGVNFPSELIDVETANTRDGSTLSAASNIFPFGFSKLGYSIGGQFVELKIKGMFELKDFKYYTAAFKFKVLSKSGDINKISLSLGATASMKSQKVKNIAIKNLVYSPAVFGSIMFPEYLNSIVSVQADKMQVGLGIISYPFFESMKSSFALIAEGRFIIDDNIKDADEASFIFQPGIQFQASENFLTKLSFQKNKNRVIELLYSFR